MECNVALTDGKMVTKQIYHTLLTYKVLLNSSRTGYNMRQWCVLKDSYMMEGHRMHAHPRTFATFNVFWH